MYVCSIVSRIPVWAGDAGESAVQRAVYGTLFFFPWALVFAVKKKKRPPRPTLIVKTMVFLN